MTKLCSHGETSNNEKTKLYIQGKDRKIHSKDNHGILQVVKIMYENRLKSSRISAIINLHSPRSFEMGCEAGKTASAFLTDGRS